MTSALAVGVAALVLAACGGGDDNDNATAASSGSGSGLVSVQDVDGTNVLADADGQTLYSADVEKSRIHCTDACLSFWEPLDASANQAKSASSDLDLDFGVVKRPDGASQLTFKGLPLYHFTEEGAGKLEGDGFTDDFQGTHFEWAAATTGGGGSSSSGSGGGDNSDNDSGYSSPY